MDFKDRVANKPNRVKLTFEDSGASSYAVVELADEPIEEGTPLNAFNMNKLLNKEDSDYIVEQGTSGIWTYEKWNSGKAVCRGTNTFMSGTGLGGNPLVISSNASPRIDYPFEFVERPVEIAFIKRRMATLITITYAMGDINTTTHTGDYRAASPTSTMFQESIDLVIDYIVEGKWK